MEGRPLHLRHLYSHEYWYIKWLIYLQLSGYISYNPTYLPSFIEFWWHIKTKPYSSIIWGPWTLARQCYPTRMVHSTITITMSLGHTHQLTLKQCITTKADYIRLTRGYISLTLERESDVIVVSGPLSIGCSRSGVVIGSPKGTIRGGRFNCGLKGPDSASLHTRTHTPTHNNRSTQTIAPHTPHPEPSPTYSHTPAPPHTPYRIVYGLCLIADTRSSAISHEAYPEPLVEFSGI